MKRALFLSCAGLLLLTGCGGEDAARTPSPVSPSPTVSAAPTASQAPWWESLAPEDLPTQVASLEELAGLGAEEAALLGEVPAAALYGLGNEEGILLERDGALSYFPQAWCPPDLPTLPELYQLDLDGDGEDEVAARYLVQAEGEQILYDLHIYDWEGGTCADCPVTAEACAALAGAELETVWSPSAGTFTLFCGGDSVTCQVPEGVSGEVSLSLDACFFRESEAGFTVVLGARAAPGGTWFANVLAGVIYSDRSFSLRDVRLEQTTVV